jgi:DNA invertase Pin-like site-specific DNA recombinase
VSSDDPANASRWLSSTTANVLGEFATRRALEADMVVAEAPRPLFLKRAVGIVRVSQVGRRAKEEKLLSPLDQRRQIERISALENLRLVNVFEELNVSGYRTKLEKRRGLWPALQMIERGEAEVLIVAYFDRFFRKLTVQAEVVQRVEEVGGRLLSVDAGEISNKTSSKWLSATVLGMMAEFHARMTAEKTYPAQVEAVAAGIIPWARLPLGYVRGEDRRAHVYDDAKKVVQKAFDLREAGMSLEGIVKFLHAQGYPRSFRSVEKMFWSRFYLGELHFGKLVNLNSHEAIIDPRQFRSVQKMRGDNRGPRGQSPSLLARQGLLVCGTCEGKMVAGGQNLKNRPDAPRKRYYDYRCAPIVSPHCERRPYISAPNLDAYVVSYVQRRLAEARGRWSSNERLIQAEADVAGKEQRLNAAVKAFDGMDDVPATREKLLEFRAEHAAALERLQELRAAFGTPALASLGDWLQMTISEQRSVLRVFIKRILVRPGRGAIEERVTIEPFEE